MQFFLIGIFRKIKEIWILKNLKDMRSYIKWFSHTWNIFAGAFWGLVWKALDCQNCFCIKIKSNKWNAFYIFSNHSILFWSLFVLWCEVSSSSVNWNDPYTSNDFSTLKRITDKNNNHTYKRICIEKGEIDLSGFWLWMCGEYPRCYPQEVT